LIKKLLSRYTTSSELKLKKAISEANKYLKHDKKVLAKQKKDVKEIAKLVNDEEIEHVFDSYSPELFEKLIKYVKNSKVSKKDTYENLYLQNIPKGIIDNAYAWINLSKLKHKDIKKMISNKDFKGMKIVLKRDFALGFRLYDLHDKLIEKGWPIELVNKLVKK